jgi:SWI/SNF-related matrix-associated actin-dependent regulator of chromatin subfamily A3
LAEKIAEVLDKEGSLHLSRFLAHLQIFIYIYRVPYVRFDGRMSAKRRQETLEAFCVPIGDVERDTSNVQSIPDVPTSEVPRRSTRPSRRGAATAVVYQEGDAISDDDDYFALEMDAESDDGLEGARSRTKKGKGKANGKSKARTQSRVASVGDTTRNRSSISNGINPKVMLISLKAGALGLNLTVANNIYL